MENLKEIFARINGILSHNPRGMTVNDLAGAMELNRNTVAKYLNIMLALGEVEMKQYGPAKVWFYSPGISLNDLMDYSTSMMAVLDPDLKVKAINTTFLAFLGLEEEDVLDQAASEVFAFLRSGLAPEVNSMINLEDLFQSSLGGVANEIDLIEIEREKAPSPCILSLKVYPTVLGGEQKGLALILDDITSSILYERGLEKSEALFHAVFQNANDGMVIIKDGKFVLLNDRAAEMMGTTPREGVGKPVIDVVAPDHKALVAERLKERFEGRGTRDIYPIEVMSSDGSRRTIEISGSLVEYEGEPADLVIVRDITQTRSGKE